MDTTYLQFNYTNRFNWFGVNNEVLAGLDLAHEEFAGYNDWHRCRRAWC